MPRLALLAPLLVALLACGDYDGPSMSTPADPPGPGIGGSGGADEGGSDGTSLGSGAGGSSTGGSSAGGQGGTPDPGPEGMTDVGTLVVLGDSIGDGGGQSPFYYDLLRDHLEAFYGPITYTNRADSGSQTSALLGQIAGLPTTLPGPVAVVVTSGGNDMKDNLFSILLGTDAAARAQMQANVAAALDALLAPGRFGPGVEVAVFEANIYDASDGQGNFASGGCAIEFDAPMGTSAYFDSWNQAIEDVVADQQQTLFDIHGHFTGHGFNGNDNWYAGDCTHPNATGHAELEALAFSLITGT